MDGPGRGYGRKVKATEDLEERDKWHHRGNIFNRIWRHLHETHPHN